MFRRFYIFGPTAADSSSKWRIVFINRLFSWGTITFFLTDSYRLLIKGIWFGLSFLLFDRYSQPIELFCLIVVIRIVFKFHIFAFAFWFLCFGFLLARPETGQSRLLFSFATVRAVLFFSCFSLCARPHRLQRGRLKRKCTFWLHLFLFWLFFLANRRPSYRRGRLRAICISSHFSSLGQQRN